jgi:tetratricopeptide (TPR) repeat protein/biotin operon repressor
MSHLASIDTAVKSARECHSKHAWEEFVSVHGDTLATTPHTRLVTEVFRQLQDDPQSLNYGTQIWSKLLQGSLSCWNLDIGCQIADHVKKILAPEVAVFASQVLLEGGHPSAARDYAQRTLKSSQVTGKQSLQLEMIVASSFAEEGKVEKSIKALERIGPLLRQAVLNDLDRANFLNRLGRLHYFTGRYKEAALVFKECAPLFAANHEWETAARAYFNVGACFQNGGFEDNREAFKMVEECRRISIEHQLQGPLSHCESFYGFEAYHAGNFAAARDHFRRALTVLPSNDKSFRRLHVMSLLCLTYFATGKYVLAKKFARQTLDLASLDESDRFKIRYVALESELLWEDGLVAESLQLLEKSIKSMEETGVHTLEKLSALARYVYQTSIAGHPLNLDKFKIDPQLEKNRNTWLEFQYTVAVHALMNQQPATELFQKCLELSRSLRAVYYEALSLHGLIASSLRDRDTDQARRLLPELEIVSSRLGDSPLKSKLLCAYAGLAYQTGDFDRAIKLLVTIEKSAAVSFPDRFAIQSCLATVEGHSPKLIHSWQIDLVARFVKIYFAPTIELPEPKTFVVSDHFTVHLDKHPALAELLTFLLERPYLATSPADVQELVWKQSVNLQGWQQKIRNAIMRLRDLIPYTMAPIILHDDQGIRFFSQAISIAWQMPEESSLELKTKRILADGPLSSQQIADRMNISIATAKRTIKKLTESQEIASEKHGRNIVYKNNAALPNRNLTLH